MDLTKVRNSAACFFSIILIASCQQKKTYGSIRFDLNGGHFENPDWTDDKVLTGVSGTPIAIDIPNPVKDGYYFVDWREKNKSGEYVTINKRQYEEGSGDNKVIKESYYYPFINDVFYAYFEPEMTINFDLGEGSATSSLVAPSLNATDFKDNKLHGYSGKSIASLKALPTVESTNEHLSFQYWYTKKPLAEVKTEEEKNKHYKLDESGEDGIYQFDKSFGSNSMQFPLSDDNTFTLYAKYKEDSKVTLHFNLPQYTDVVQTQTFQAKDTIKAGLVQTVKSVLNIDLEAEGSKFYPLDTKDKRFAGFYTDPEFTKQIYLTSFINDNDFDIYMKWQDRVSVTLDYDGGKVSDKTSETLTNYYQGDRLIDYDNVIDTNKKSEFLTNHTPVKENYTFLGFYDTESGISQDTDGNSIINYFDFNNTKIAEDKTTITLKAYYSEYPKLSLVYDYPQSYTGTKLENPSPCHVKPGDSIVDKINTFKAGVESTSEFVISYIYSIISETNQDTGVTTQKECESAPTNISDSDITYYLKLEYRPIATLATYFGQYESTYKPDSSIQDTAEVINDSTSNEKSSCTLTSSWLDSKKDDIELSENGSQTLYLYDGVYTKAIETSQGSGEYNLEDTLKLPFFGNSSYINPVNYTFYRKYTKAVKLTFVQKPNTNPTGSETSSLTMDILPGKMCSDYQAEIQTLLNGISYSKLFVFENGGYSELSTVLPNVDSIIYYQ